MRVEGEGCVVACIRIYFFGMLSDHTYERIIQGDNNVWLDRFGSMRGHKTAAQRTCEDRYNELCVARDHLQYGYVVCMWRVRQFNAAHSTGVGSSIPKNIRRMIWTFCVSDWHQRRDLLKAAIRLRFGGCSHHYENIRAQTSEWRICPCEAVQMVFHDRMDVLCIIADGMHKSVEDSYPRHGGKYMGILRYVLYTLANNAEYKYMIRRDSPRLIVSPRSIKSKPTFFQHILSPFQSERVWIRIKTPDKTFKAKVGQTVRFEPFKYRAESTANLDFEHLFFGLDYTVEACLPPPMGYRLVRHTTKRSFGGTLIDTTTHVYCDAYGMCCIDVCNDRWTGQFHVVVIDKDDEEEEEEKKEEAKTNDIH